MAEYVLRWHSDLFGDLCVYNLGAHIFYCFYFFQMNSMVLTLQGRQEVQEPPRAEQALCYMVVADLGPGGD